MPPSNGCLAAGCGSLIGIGVVGVGVLLLSWFVGSTALWLWAFFFTTIYVGMWLGGLLGSLWMLQGIGLEPDVLGHTLVFQLVGFLVGIGLLHAGTGSLNYGLFTYWAASIAALPLLSGGAYVLARLLAARHQP